MKRLIGRQSELRAIQACLRSGRHLLIEGPVGVGKTCLASHACESTGRKLIRIDGDQRFSEQKMSGAFDPPMVLKKGYSAETFVAGPLIEAMEQGKVLFINELNRLPESVQNILLPALDEGIVYVPKIGQIEAVSGFQVLATQNPKEFVATSHLSEAILDRFELIRLGYQSLEEELEITSSYHYSGQVSKTSEFDSIVARAVALVRSTREDRRLRRGASVRAAIAVAELASDYVSEIGVDGAIEAAAEMALPTRVEFDPDLSEFDQEPNLKSMIKDWLGPEKKN